MFKVYKKIDNLEVWIYTKDIPSFDSHKLESFIKTASSRKVENPDKNIAKEIYNRLEDLLLDAEIDFSEMKVRVWQNYDFYFEYTLLEE